MSQPQAKYRKDYHPSNYHINMTNLTFELHDDHTLVTANIVFSRVKEIDHDAPLILDGVDLKLKSIKLNDKDLTESQYQVGHETLTVTDLPASFTLQTVVQIHPENNTSLEGLYQTDNMLCTQCESHGFRKITYYLDRPDVMAKFTVKIIADKSQYPVILSNGNKIDSGDYEDGKHYAVWQDPFSKPSYLFALVAGNLTVLEDTFTTQSGRKVDLQIFAYQKDIDKCHHAMKSLKEAMRWDEQRFALEYDLDIFMIVAAPDFNMGAMENKGLNIFNTRYVLANNTTATDIDFELIQAVVGHEYFHNWTGNRVTCRDWFQLSLKEGLTVFRDEEFTSDHHNRDVKRIEDVKRLRAVQFAEDDSPMAHPIRPDSYIEMNNFYTTTVYHKGAAVIRMLHTLLSEAGFRRGMDLYFKRHDGQAVTCDDFVNAMADANQKDMTLFKRWYSQSGTPNITITDSYDSSQKIYTLHIKQSTPPTANQKEKLPLHIPIKVGLVNSHGQDIKEHVLELTQEKQDFMFENVNEKPTPSLLRDFSAPVKIHYDYAEADLLHLFAHDSNAFNRWNAGQELAKRILLKQADVSTPFIKAIKSTLLDTTQDKSLIAEIVMLPTEAEVAEWMPTILVDELHATRTHMIHQLGECLKDTWLHTYHQCHGNTAYDLQHDNITKRKLKGICLYYLMNAHDQTIAIELAQTLFTEADNMTDQLSAFSVLLLAEDKNIRDQAIDVFYQQWREEDLVINKWLKHQALMPHADTVKHVQKLVAHPAFHIKNPNKVYALISSFTNNFYQFHRKDGTGYKFLTDMILKLDVLNPVVASRITRALMNWQRYDTERQAMMKTALQTLQQAKLSKDVFEIVSKSLIEPTIDINR